MIGEFGEWISPGEPEDMMELARFLVENCEPSDEVQALAAELERLGSPEGQEE